MNAVDKLNLFQSAPRKPALKSDVTDRAAREIIQTESAQRDVKTARLREARMLRDNALVENRRNGCEPLLRSGAKKKQARALKAPI